jgi:hypothetical protein
MERAMTKQQSAGGQPIDVAGVQPVAQEIIRAVAQVYLAHLGPALVTLVAHGSAVKGGLIVGSSDVDLVAFVEATILTPSDELPLGRALSLHRDLARIDPSPFRYLSGHLYPVGGGPGPGFIPGTYHVLWGSRDVLVATSDELLAAARASLRTLDPVAMSAQLSNALLDHGEDRLFNRVRLLATKVWPVMYHVACLCTADGVAVWQQRKAEIVTLLSEDQLVGCTATRWKDAVTRHYLGGETVDTALDAIRAGVAFLEAAAAWIAHRA